MGLYYLDLFSGIGGFALAAQWAEMKFDECFFSEIDPYSVNVYKKRFPSSKPLGDIRFVNKAENDLILGKIHTIRQNYKYWKHFEGQEIALFTWDGKPYQKGSTQKVFCIKRLVSVQEVIIYENSGFFLSNMDMATNKNIDLCFLAKNDGFDCIHEFIKWFEKYPFGKLGILHFTDFLY